VFESRHFTRGEFLFRGDRGRFGLAEAGTAQVLVRLKPERHKFWSG
jgi:hypothetical protein